MQSSPLQELNLTGCRFTFGWQMPLPRVSLNGTSCLSLISQITTNQNNDQRSRLNFTQILGALRVKLPGGAQQSSNTPKKLPEESTFSNDSCSNSAEDLEFLDSLKGQWPNLVKLSLTEVVASFQV